MGDDDDSGGNKELVSSVSSNGKGSKNKRKYLSEILQDKMDMSSLTEFPRYELLQETLQSISNEVGLLKEFDTVSKEQEGDESNKDEWDHPMVSFLLVILSDIMQLMFNRAIQKMVERGYIREIAEQTFLRCGLYHSTKDTVLNAVEGALIFMNKVKDLENSRCDVFSDFDQLVNYTILEMVSVLKEVSPGITVNEAMWRLLICDLNLLHACVVKRDHLGKISLEEMFGEGASGTVQPPLNKEASESIRLNLKNAHFPKALALCTPSSHSEDPTIRAPTQSSDPKDSHVHEWVITGTGKESSLPVPDLVGKFMGIGREHIQNAIQCPDTKEKSGCCRKGSSVCSKRDMYRQRMLHFDKSHKGRSKGAYKGRVAMGTMGLDKPLKLPSASSGIVMKGTFSKITSSVGPNSPLPEGNYNVSNISATQATDSTAKLASKGAVFALPAVNTKTPESSSVQSEPTTKTSGDNNSGSSDMPDFCAGIPYDESLGKHIPQDDKEESILKLASHIKALLREIQYWNDWANEKVMQATRRLGKDQVELKILTQEREDSEKFKKDKQNSDESNLKRLSEMDNAINNANKQIAMANSTIRSLENQNSVLQTQLEVAKKKHSGTNAKLEKALLGEQEALKKSQAMDKLKVYLQEELTTLRHHAADLRLQLENAEDRKDQLEALWKQEEREKQKYLAELEILRMETEQQKGKTKAEEDHMRGTAEIASRKCNQHIKKLELEISQLRFASESLKIAALLGGVDMNYGGSLLGSKRASICQDFQVPEVDEKTMVFQDNFGEGSVKPERECVMCLTEEMSVVFFPCAHQVLCRDCNVLHEKKGMNDCPSCRTPIQERIYARFAD